MIDRAGKRFRRELEDALRPDGWQLSETRPLIVPPTPETFVRPTNDGWVAVLHAVRYSRDDLDLPWWQPGAYGAIEVRSWATFSPAERLAGHLELFDADVAFDVAPVFLVPGQTPGYRQFRGPEDDERVLEDVRSYGQDIVLPATEQNARLDGWLARYGPIEEHDLARTRRTVPVMLLAHGRTDEALQHLFAALEHPRLADDEAFVAFADRVRRFVEAGAVVPADGMPLATVAAERNQKSRELAAAKANAAEKSREADSAEDEEEVSWWEALAGLGLIIAVVAFFVGKGAAIAGTDLGFGWLPVVGIVGFVVLVLAEKFDELRDGWRERLGSADRVEEYLERKRRERLAETNGEHPSDEEGPAAESGSRDPV